MLVLAVEVKAPVASFRRRLDHTYQRTLPLPPPTTLVGLAGAAMGIDTATLWSDTSPLNELKVQALAQNQPGRATDMWTLLKIKGGKMERSPYLRELLYNAQFTLLYGGEQNLLERLQQAFRQPAYPLSLGRDDELAHIESCALKECLPVNEPPHRFWGAILPGDLRLLNARPLLQEGATYEPAVVERLPTRFQIGNRGERDPVDTRDFTFLPYTVQVEVDAGALNREVYRYDDRLFVWLP
ncbi:MAG: CRISPR-associated protein Cas5 [Fimbriimonadales bacterium]